MNKPTASPESASTNGTPAVTRRALFLAFLEIGISGFGGVLPWARRVLVERRAWLTPKEFTETLSLGQALPGPNVVNMSIVIGHRFHGAIGSLLAFAGIMGAPFLIILLIGMLYSHYGALETVHHSLSGVAAAAAGLVVATGIKMAIAMPRTWFPIGIAIVTFICSAILRVPLLAVLAIAGPLGIALTWNKHR